MKPQPTAALPAILAALLLAGCGNLVPPAEAPQPALRAQFRIPADGPATPAATAAPNEWDDFFTDPRLRTVVGLALADNRGLRAGAEAVARVRALYRVAENAVLPELDAQAGATRQRSGGSSSQSFTLGVNVPAWEIDLFDRLGSLKGAALARYLAQQDNQQAARLALVAETAATWLQLAADRQRLRLAEQQRDSQQHTLSLTERRYQAGAASGLDRARAQAAFEAARGAAAEAAGTAERTRLALELLAGQPLVEALLPDEQAQGPAAGAATALPEPPAGLPATVLLQRPDLRATEQALQAAAFDVGAARAARFPRITLTASAGRRSSELDDLLRGGGSFWSLAPQLTLPLFDAGARQAEAEAAEAARRQALASYEAALQAAFREVADALAVRDRLDERLHAQQAQVAAAERGADLAEQSYRLGRASQLELLDAQRQVSSARQGLVTLRQAEQVNRVSLLKALGGRWVQAAP
ncbi:efflux transporter outer membrane subunit [Pseudorhodoferax sp.]|uniref:efflux transporter outer membrane subunit n=1 Tax=Pseudorhodoferax sp. TaxID=1993553 RepID=UPI002DD69ACE|nr:efflux transporter outer membrane subunit [Pseudorhodoferax sp.]